MGGNTVAVFTGEFDVTADAVIVELERRGVPVFRCDPGAFPSALVLGARFGGSWSFIISFGGLLIVWILFNIYAANKFDPFPFILMNLRKVL